jgi:protein phosphatase
MSHLRIVDQAGLSDVGRQRTANEDTLVLAPPFFAVADGMGGARAGEVASSLAAGVFDEERTDGPDSGEAQLTRIVREANRRIYEMAERDESTRGMGTTLTVAKVEGDQVRIGHVGDSRAYMLRGGELRQLTNDHSLVAELERTGQISPEAAETHPQRSIITRALGPEADVEVDTYTIPGRPGDVFLICSDGLTGMIGDGDVEAIVRGASTLEQAAKELVEAANQSGGRDNITVVMFRLDGDSPDGIDEDTMAGEATIAGTLSADELRAAGRFDRDDATPEARVAVAERLGDTPADATFIQRRQPPPPVPQARRKPRRRWGRAIVRVVVSVLVICAVGLGLYQLSRQVYFVGTNDAGLVTVYRGVPYDLPFGVSLYEEDYASAVPARAIPTARRARVLDHEWRSREDAEDLVRELEQGRLDAGGSAG